MPLIELKFSSEIFESQPSHGGWLEKRENRKTPKIRYCFLNTGILKYYGKGPSGANFDLEDTSASITSPAREGADLKGDILLLGATISIIDHNILSITLKGEKSSIHQFKAKDDKEALDWQSALLKEVQFQNIQALIKNSRSPEIIEWYYQYQADIFRKHSFLSKATEAQMHFPSFSSPDASISLFTISMSEDRQGLLLSTLNLPGSTSKHGNKRTFNRLESINNGRIIAFTDIIGATLLHGWDLSDANQFEFILITREDQLSIRMEAFGVTWLQAVREMAVFHQLPKPAARSASVSSPVRTMSSTMNSLMEFSVNSSAVFACSSDVQLLIEGFHRVSSKSTSIAEIGSRFNTILKLIPELKVNKEAALNFGERNEEFVRALGDPDVGILFNAKDSDKALLNLHLINLSAKLNEVIKYLKSQSVDGWLIINVSSRIQDSAKIKYNAFDSEIISILNALIKALGLDSHIIFTKKDYTMAVNVKKSIDALGGIEAIFEDVAKERALARLIQADGGDIHRELVDFMQKVESGSDPRKSMHSTDRFSFSYVHSVDYPMDGEISGSSLLYMLRRYFCCGICVCRRDGNKSASNDVVSAFSKKKGSKGAIAGNPQLKEKLIVSNHDNSSL